MKRNAGITALKKEIHRQTGKKPMSSFTVGCLTGEPYESYDLKRGLVILITIKQADQQKFEDDLKKLGKLLGYMKPPITLIFPSGGTLILPDSFKTLCSQLGAVIILDSERQVSDVIRRLEPRDFDTAIEE
jgi:hypothetical protein